MTVKLTFECDGRNCDERVKFPVVALAEDAIQARDRLLKEGWIVRPAQRENVLRALCPSCAVLARYTKPGVHKGVPG